MTDTMANAEEPTEDDEVEEAEEADLDEVEPSEADLADATVPPDPATGADVESIQELIVKQEAAAEKAEAADDDEVAADPHQGRQAAGRSGRYARGPDPGDGIRLQAMLPGQAPRTAGGQEEDAVQRLRLRARPTLTISLLISLVSGLALSLAFPPAGLWPIAFVAMAPLLWLLEDSSARRGLLLGFVFGLAFYGATIYWIFLFGALAWTGLTIVLALGVGIFGLLVPIWRRPGRPFVNAVVIAALWTVIDWIRSAWPLGGFGWGSLGVSQVDNRLHGAPRVGGGGVGRHLRGRAGQRADRGAGGRSRAIGDDGSSASSRSWRWWQARC